MPLVTSDIPKLILPGIKTIFQEALAEYSSSDYTKIATIAPSDSDTETYAWLGANPGMREFGAERKPVGLSEHSYSIKNKEWEASIAIDRTAIEDEKYGQIEMRIRQLAEEVARHKNELVFTYLKNAFTNTCYDGQYLSDTDHSEGDSGTQSNKGTTALGAAALQAAITAMMKFKDDKGKLLGIIPDTLCVPPDLQWTAMELLESTYWPETSGTAGTVKMGNNVLKGKLNLLVSPYLTDTTDWFVASTSGVVKPIILQERLDTEFGALEGNSENGFMRGKYVYGVRARYSVGSGLWQKLYGSAVTGA